MKTYKQLTLVVFGLLFGTFLNLKAQATTECMQNLSLVGTSCKQKNYAEALAPWEKVYSDCPSAHKNIYIHGVAIINWQIGQTQDAAQKKVLFDKLMLLHDQQIELFAQTSKTERAKILARKAQYYLTHKPKDRATVYPWYKEYIDVYGAKSSLSTIQQFIITSSELYKADNQLAEQYINDYILINGFLEAVIANPNAKYIEQYKAVKNNSDLIFARSGAADCSRLNEIYIASIEANKTNNEYLINTMRFFKGLKCTDQEAYFTAVKYSHAIAPNSESALGLAQMSYGKEEYQNAITYYNDAVNLLESDEEKADTYFKIASCYMQLKNSIKVREFCKKSLELNANQGMPHILLGIIYGSAGTIENDDILDKGKFWAAVDQFNKAKKAEATPEIIEQANKQIAIYSAHYPTKEQIFMHPELSNKTSFYVGGWINESTTIRSK